MGREAEAIFCGADCGGSEASRNGCPGGGTDPASGDFGADILSLEEAIGWPGGRPGSPAETVAGRERSAEAGGGRLEVGQSDASGCVVKEIVKPWRRRPVVGYRCGGYGVSEGRACGVARLARSTKKGHILPDHMQMMFSIPAMYALWPELEFIRGKSAIHLERMYEEQDQKFVGQSFLGGCTPFRREAGMMLQPGSTVATGSRKSSG